MMEACYTDMETTAGGLDEGAFEDVVDDYLVEQGLLALGSDQCWGAMLAMQIGCRANRDCTPGFVRGNNHLKNKFCDKCRRGVFVRADRVRVLPDQLRDDYSNSQAAGLWTSMPTDPTVGFRVINQSHKCKGPKLLLLNGEPSPPVASLAPPSDAFVINNQWVHLRVSNGTLVPSLAHEVDSTPVACAPLWAAHGVGGARMRDEREAKRARPSTSVSTASPPSPALGPSSHGCGLITTTHLQAGGGAFQPVYSVTHHQPSLETLRSAHAEFGALLSAALSSPTSSLSDSQHASLANLLAALEVSADLLRLPGAAAASASASASAHDEYSPTDDTVEGAHGHDDTTFLSWPPSPPGTAASGQRHHAGGALRTTTTCHIPRLPTHARTLSVQPPPPPHGATTRVAQLYLYLLILCTSAVSGQGLIALLTYAFPYLCEGPHTENEPPMVVTYAFVVSAMLACQLLVAEVVGLLPVGSADYYHLFSCVTRCCLHTQRKKWSRVRVADTPSANEAHTDNGICGGQHAHAVEASLTAAAKQEAMHHPSSLLRGWITWAAAASAVTVVGTVIWMLITRANGINIHHQEAMIGLVSR